MNRINSALRNIIALITLAALALAVLWLVSRQASPQPIAQATTQPASPTVTPQPVVSPSFTATPNSDKIPTPTEQPVQVQEATPEPTVTPFTPEAVQVRVIPITIEPTPLPTPTFEALIGQDIGGYVFSQARPISNTIGYSLPFFDWLPDDSDQLLIMRGLTLEVMDITTGETQAYSDGKTMVTNPVWLPTRQAAAYLTFDEQDPTQQYLWVSENSQTLRTASPIFTTTWIPPLIATQDGQSVILFDTNWQLVQINDFNIQNQALPLITETDKFAPSNANHDQVYKSVSSPSGDKIIFHNAHNFLLTNLETKDIKPLPLQTLTANKDKILLNPQCVRWRPDEQVLALTGQADGSSVSSINYLYLLDLNTDKFQQIIHPFLYIQDITWTPDGKNLLVSATYDEKLVVVPAVSTEPFPTRVSGVFLIDVITNEIKPLGIPDRDAQLGECQMHWSPDGTKIVFNYFDFTEDVNTTALYIIDVSQP